MMALRAANRPLESEYPVALGRLRISNVFLKKGDLITFSEFSFKKLIYTLNSSAFFSFFYNFVEIDHYSKTLIVLKDYESLSNEDINLIYKKYLNLKYFIDYFK